MSSKTDVGASSPLFAVVGGTGRQGGATAHALLGRKARVRALVRDPQADAATALAQQGAELFRADLDDPASLRSAFTGVAGVFAMTTYAPPHGTDGEVRHGMAIADAVRAAGRPHLVYSSVGGAERHTGIPHFESKRRVEEYIEEIGLSATFVRPTFFMENFARMVPQPENGTLVLRMPLPAGVPLQMVATEDIGAVSAAALLSPADVPGGAVEIAGDELTGEEIAAAFGTHDGSPARYEALPVTVLAQDADRQAMFTWFAHPPAYQADFTLTRKLAPGVRDLPTWIADNR